MIWVSNDDVVEDFDFEKLTGSNEVSGNFDVRFRWSWITARVRMLCGASIYVPHLWRSSRRAVCRQDRLLASHNYSLASQAGCRRCVARRTTFACLWEMSFSQTEGFELHHQTIST